MKERNRTRIRKLYKEYRNLEREKEAVFNLIKSREKRRKNLETRIYNLKTGYRDLSRRETELYLKIGRAKGIHCPARTTEEWDPTLWKCLCRSNEDGRDLDDLYSETCMCCKLSQSTIQIKSMIYKIKGEN